MSDFDTVLERLLVDDGFRAALAADPGAALTGYQLAPDEVELLYTQAGGDPGGQGAVETRTSKSSVFGLLGAFTESAGGGGGSSFGAAGGGAAGHLGAAGGHGSLSEAAPGGQEDLSGGAPSDQVQFGQAASLGGHEQFGGGAHQALGAATPGDHAPAHYHPRIDADGDGRADHYTAVQHRDGRVDIYVDRNHDGRTDFIGHDRDHDGLVETADYDEDFNGSYETHMRDLNGDGWLDTRTVTPDGQSTTGAESFGQNPPGPEESFGPG